MKSIHAQTAQAIRNELKEKRPGTKFSVKSDSFAGGNAVRISWTDGATVEQVKEIVDKYKYGHFDGMHDIYEMSNNNDDIPQVKYVSTYRRYSDQASEDVVKFIRENFQDCEDFDTQSYSKNYKEWGSTVVHRYLYKMNLENSTVEEQISAEIAI